MPLRPSGVEGRSGQTMAQRIGAALPFGIASSLFADGIPENRSGIRCHRSAIDPYGFDDRFQTA